MAWNALVLGGGGAKGEFEVGVLEHLSQKQFEFDFFTGVSVGALNVSMLAQYTSLSTAVPALESLWAEIKSDDDVYTKPFLGEPLALWNKRESVFNSDPLQRRIASHVDWNRLASSGKIWAIGVTSLTDGCYYLVSNDAALVAASRKPGATLDLAQGAIASAVDDFVLASASMPFLFPPVRIYDHEFVDGGLRDITPLSAAFLAAPPAGQIPPGSRVVAVSTSPQAMPGATADDLDGGAKILARSVDIMTNEILENDIEEAIETNLIPGYKHIEVVALRPDRDFELGALEFGDAGKRAAFRQHGREVAARAFP
ncbi:MAG: patatin-like phospholipase family protein [Myxococcales bacterium]